MTWTKGFQVNRGSFYSAGVGNDYYFAEQINTIINSTRGNFVINGLDVSILNSGDLTANTTHLRISAGKVLVNGQVKSVSQTDINLYSAHSILTSGQARHVIVYVDSSSLIQTALGPIASDGNQEPPEIVENSVPLWIIYLVQSDSVLDLNQIGDMRLFAPLGAFYGRNGRQDHIWFKGMNSEYAHVHAEQTGRKFFFGYNLWHDGTAWVRDDANIEGMHLYIRPESTLESSEFAIEIYDGSWHSLFKLFGDKTINNYGSRKIDHGITAMRYENVASYVNRNSSVTGQVKITLPTNLAQAGKDNVMITFVIYGYNFVDGNAAWAMAIGGYNYNPATPWSVTDANMLFGDPPFNVVKFGNDGSNDFILLGTTTDVWSYPMLYVTEVEVHWSNYSNLETGWSIQIATTEPSTVYRTLNLRKIGDGSGNSFRLKNENGYVDIGPQNTALLHIYTDRSGIAFNKSIMAVLGSTYDLGTSTYRWKDLWISNIIKGINTWINMSDGIQFEADTTIFPGRRTMIGFSPGTGTTDWRLWWAPRNSSDTGWESSKEFGYDQKKGAWYSETGMLMNEKGVTLNPPQDATSGITKYFNETVILADGHPVLSIYINSIIDNDTESNTALGNDVIDIFLEISVDSGGTWVEIAEALGVTGNNPRFSFTITQRQFRTQSGNDVRIRVKAVELAGNVKSYNIAAISIYWSILVDSG